MGPWNRDDENDGRDVPRLDRRAFRNTQHPATHNPKWRALGRRDGVPHRSCDRCSHVEFKNRSGQWVQETNCRHGR